MTKKSFDFKKEYKALYTPGSQPAVIEVPSMNFIMVDGSGDPNDNPDYQEAIELLYGLSYAIKMSDKEDRQPTGYFPYVVPPLEGLWWVADGPFSLTKRDNWRWTSMIRQPDFVTPDFFEWACSKVKVKKPGLTVEKARFETFAEGLCVQVMHIGPYSTEPETVQKMKDYMVQEGLMDKVEAGGKHHEIYLSDPKRTKPERLKTVIRHPVMRSS